MPPVSQEGRGANRLLRVMALSAGPWTESWNDGVERRVQSMFPASQEQVVVREVTP